MKKTLATLIAIIVAVAGLHAFRAMQQPVVTGKFDHPEEVQAAYAIRGTDSIRIKPDKGHFSFAIKPGSWKILINARAPLRDVVLDVTMKEGEITDLGEIKLQL